MKNALITLVALILVSAGAKAQKIEAEGSVMARLIYPKKQGCGIKCAAISLGSGLYLAGAVWGVGGGIDETTGSDLPASTKSKAIGFAVGAVGAPIVQAARSTLRSQDEFVDATLSTKVKVQLVPWGEGKARLNFQISGKKKCGSVNNNFLALETAKGSYDLYSQSPIGETVPVGEVFFDEKSVQIHFSKGLEAKTMGLGGSLCDWAIAKDASIVLNR